MTVQQPQPNDLIIPIMQALPEFDPTRDTIAGRSVGEAMWQRYLMGHNPDRVIIDVPSHIRIITPSFFYGLFKNAFTVDTTLEEMKSRIVLINPGSSSLLNLEHALRRICAEHEYRKRPSRIQIYIVPEFYLLLAVVGVCLGLLLL